jgi:hypothetical protein
MIADKDRSGWFGASDTSYIMGNWTTKSFGNWWLTKDGISRNDYCNIAMLAGTHKEHQILEYIKVAEMDKQILVPKLSLRVNLDGNDERYIYEVKTYKQNNGFKIPKKYWQQVQVQMYVSRLQGKIVAYGLADDDYHNFMLPIDENRLCEYDIEYDSTFIEREYLPRLKYFKHCLDHHKLPRKEEFNVYSKENL